MRNERKLLFGAVGIALLIAGVLAVNAIVGGGDGQPVEDDFDVERASMLVTQELNDVRTEHGLDELEANDTLVQVALDHSEYMALQGDDKEELDRELAFFDDQNRSPAQRVNDSGYVCDRGATQNALRISPPIGVGEETVAEVTAQNFTDHNVTRDRLLNEEHEEHGVGLVRTAEWLYVTQKLC